VCSHRCLFRKALVGLLACSLGVTPPVWGGAGPIGTVRGLKEAKLSIDGGKTWLAVTARGLPVVRGAELRSAAGTAELELADGSRVNVFPFTALRFEGAQSITEIAVSYGRLTFHLPADARVKILTPSARLDPVRGRVMKGEVFLDGGGLMGLKMAEGAFEVRSRADEAQPILAGLEPVFLPKRPATSSAFFSTDPLPRVPGDAKGVFTPSGESIGYVGPDRSLVIHPGFTKDLTRPFSPKLVQLAMTKIPEKDRGDDVVPLFDVNGVYVGYLSGPMFYAEGTRPAGPSDVASPRERSGATGAIGAVGVLGVGSIAGLGAGVAGGLQDASKKAKKCPPEPPPPATPRRPPRPDCR